MNDKTGIRRLSRRTKIIVIAAIVVVVSAISTTLSWNMPHSFGMSAPTSSAPTNPKVQSTLDDLVTDDGFPAALAAVTSADGETVDYVSGVGDLSSNAPVPADGQVRIGSNTKTFTAVAVLQLVDDGLVELDESVATYLPGLLERYGVDGTTITVRQLLQHTSGLPNYTTALIDTVFTTGPQYMETRELLDAAFTFPVTFAPGDGWAYSNTNYTLAGLIVEKLTRQPIGVAITERIIDPLGLENTSYPAAGDLTIPGAHPLGYHSGDDGELTDFTEYDPALGGAAGQMIASPSDMNRFMRALLDGDLLSAETLAEMKTTVPADELWEGSGYGLGLQSFPLSCGETAWGHGGDIPGYQTRNATVPGGATATIAVTALPGALATEEDDIIGLVMDMYDALDTTLCA